MSELVLEKNNELPQSWIKAKLNDLCDLIGGGTPSRSNPEYFGGNIIWLTPTEIPKKMIVRINDSKEKITDLGLKKSSARIIPKESVLLTSRASIGYVAIAGDEVTTNQGFASFICHKPLFNYYLAYWLWGNKKNIESEATGTTFKEISKSKLREMLIPLPPLKEQKRIVVKIEELFSIKNKIMENLMSLKIQSHQFRNVVLQRAIEGNLTKEWRQSNPKLTVFTNIQNRREILKNNPSYKYNKLPLEKENKFPKLPSSWSWSNAFEVCSKITDGDHQTPLSLPTGRPMLSAKDVRDGYVDYDNIQYVSEEDFLRNIKRCDPKPNDVLLVCVGATIGRAAIVEKDISFMIVRSVALLRPSPLILPKFLLLSIHSPLIQRFMKKMTKGTARGGLYLNQIKNIPISLPHIDEQKEILRIVDDLFSIIVNNEKIIDKTLLELDRLGHVILESAFAGNLVLQDPNDEPVSILLEKIKKNKEKILQNQTIIKTRQFKSKRAKNAK